MAIKNYNNMFKLNIGCGRLRKENFVNIDCAQYIDGTGKAMVDIVRDIDLHGLPFADNSVDEIAADNVLEHLNNLAFVLNECHRVLVPNGILHGIVPNAGTDGSFRDPTHVRFFTLTTFDYFTGQCAANPVLPSHPKYARYDFLPWNKIKVCRPENNGNISFELSPRKV